MKIKILPIVLALLAILIVVSCDSNSSKKSSNKSSCIDGIYLHEVSHFEVRLKISGNSWSGTETLITGTGNNEVFNVSGSVKGRYLYDKHGNKVGRCVGEALRYVSYDGEKTLRKL